MILTLDAALDGCGAAVVADGRVLAELKHRGGRGSAAALPSMAAAVLRLSGVDAGGLVGLAVTVGPGSFTGIRAALSLAHGIGLGANRPVWGVSVSAAIRALAEEVDARPVWVAVDSRRGRVFLDNGKRIATIEFGEMPLPCGPVSLAGDAAVPVASRLAARGGDVLLLATRDVEPLGIARGAMVWPVPAYPLYVDGPEARKGVGIRPAPI